MAKEDIEIKEDKSISVDDTGKTPVVEVDKKVEVAPEGDKPAETDAPDADDFNNVIMLLNDLDKQTGGKGEITEVPDVLKGSLRYMVDALSFVRDRFEDPLHKAILDDLYDQEEDGKTPSVEVAIARTVPLAKIQELAESEDYESAQGALTESLASAKSMEEEDALLDASFQESQKAGEEYAAEMGYDEAEKNALFQVVLDLFQIMGDGKLTKEEFAKVDKMRNYDKDTGDLRSQINVQDTKEVLPDQASVEAALKTPITKSAPAPSDTPGMGSMSAYQNAATDLSEIGKRKRKR